MKVNIDWFFDEDMLLHLIYVNGKQFHYEGAASFNSQKMIDNIQKFSDAVGIELKITRHNWCYATNPDPMDTSTEVKVDMSDW